MFLASALLAGETAAPPAEPLPPAKFNEPPAPKEFARAAALIDTKTLADKLKKNTPGLVLIDARARDLYEDGHIATARSVVSDTFQDPQSAPYFLVSREAVQKTCLETGIHADSDVVIYDGGDGRLAARVWFTLHAYGHERVAILDGGYGKWRDENRAFSNDPPEIKAGTFVPSEKPRSVCAFSELAQFRTRVHTLGKLPTTTMIDARSTAEYMGEDSRAKTGGHIPGAANIEWTSFLAPAALKPGAKEPPFRVWRSAPEIHALLRLSGIEKDQKIAVYDQAGGRSSHVFFTLWLMGFESAYNYTAGWREYGNRDDVEIER